jgi:cell division protein FtsI/penicillin-binding protein 2
VFGKVGADVVGAEQLEQKLREFGFNRPIPFDFALQPSQASVPRDRYPLALTSAGFGDVYVSPVHAALIAAAVGNGGVMMRPFAVGSIADASGAELYRARPEALGRCLTPEAARRVAEMMQMTVTRGTSTKVFARYARKLWKDVRIAGKTGSLTGENPRGNYEWFIGFAPAENPKIAVASLVVNHDLWHIKGTYVAQAVMREFFGM